MAAGVGGAQKQLIHGLVEQSRERVVQVRAGQSLVEVLESPSPSRLQLHHQPPPHHRRRQAAECLRREGDGDDERLPDMKIVYEARRHASAVAKSDEAQSDASALRKNLRKRGILAAASTASATVAAPSPSLRDLQHAIAMEAEIAPQRQHHRRQDRIERAPREEGSSVKYREYMDSKSERVETLHANDRRKAITRSTRRMMTLAATAIQQQQQQLEEQSQVSVAAAGVVRTLAVLKAKNALLTLKQRAALAQSPDAQDLAGMKNAHFAFLDFKKTADERDQRKHARMALGADESNSHKRTPIHFGDQICFISEASDLPLSMGSDGRTCHVSTLSAGPHMMFTIVDFRNPSRHSAVSDEDEFWLRVDASLVRHRSRATAAALYGAASLDDSSDDAADEVDVSSLLSETHFFLGCAGSIEDPVDDVADNRRGPGSPGRAGCNKENVRGVARSYAMPPLASSSLSSPDKIPSAHDTFRLVAIRATVPSADYYGDDSATREYAIETNESVVHLARWRFTRNAHRSLPRAAGRSLEAAAGGDEADEHRLLLNCASVHLSLNHLVLESDAARGNRGVLRDFSAADSKRSAADATQGTHQDVRQVLQRRGRTHTSAASWQVRLLHRATRRDATAGSPRQKSPERSSSPQRVVAELLESSPAEWLKKKQEAVERNDTVIRSKRTLARTAKHAYERVAEQSNRKLAEIEQHKARHQLEYFQARYHAIFETEEEEAENGDGGEHPPLSQPHQRQQGGARGLLPRIG